MQPELEHVGFLSRGPAQTRFFGSLLGNACWAGSVILLRGPFGAGKTTLVQGIAAGLGVHGRVNSPSFTLVNEHQGRLTLNHVDLFRLQQLDVEMEQALESYEGGEGVTVIEWPDLLPADLLAGALLIDLQIAGDAERSLVAHAERSGWSGPQLVAMMEEALRSAVGGAE